MMQLDEAFRGESFITDLGTTVTATMDGEEKSWAVMPSSPPARMASTISPWRWGAA